MPLLDRNQFQTPKDSIALVHGRSFVPLSHRQRSINIGILKKIVKTDLGFNGSGPIEYNLGCRVVLS